MSVNKQDHQTLQSKFYKIVFCLILFQTAGASADEVTEEDFLSEEPIIVSSATRLSQELQDVPASVTVIDRKMIEASSAINLIELLRLVPGFQVGSIDGTESTATYHGLSTQHNKRLQILVNGRSVYQSTFGGALWYNLPVSIDEIEKIEVLRGPNAASFGANAFSAVVNITTFHSDNKPGLKIGHLGGGRDTKRNYFSYAKGLESTSFRINAEIESNTGYQDTYLNSHLNIGDPLLPLNTDYPLYDDHFHRQMNLRIDHVGDKGSNHMLEFGFKNLKFGQGYIDTLNDGYFDRVAPFNKMVDSYYFNYLWEKTESLLLTNRLRISYNFIDQDETWFGSVARGGFGNPDPLPDSWYRNTSFQDRRIDLEFQQNRILSPTLQTVWGLGARYDESNSGGQLLDDSHSRYSFSTFGHIEWKTNQYVTLNAGGFLENHEDIGTYFSPRLALNLKPNQANAFRATISQAYRMPSFEAEYTDSYTIVAYDVGPPLNLPEGFPFDFYSTGNQELEPELMTSYELGYHGLFFDDKLNIDIRLAKEKIEDIIEGTKTNNGKNDPFIPRFRWLNYGQADIDSAELQLSYRPSEKSLLMLHASYANISGYKSERYTDFTGDTSDCPDYDNDGNGDPPVNANSCLDETLDRNTPQLTTGILVSHRFDNGVSISSQYNFHEAYLTSGKGDVLNTPFETVDIKFSKTWSINKTDIKASLIVRNIANEYYEDFENDNLVGREAYFQLEAALF